jgi:hypothetical protein
MTKEQKNQLLIDTGYELFATCDSGSPSLMRKLDARDAIKLALEGAAPPDHVRLVQDCIVPLCRSFSIVGLIRMTAIAGAMVSEDPEAIDKLVRLVAQGVWSEL